MSTKTKSISVEYECNSCKGTGIYRGMGERGAIGVVCSNCGGEGKATHYFEYKEFTGRKKARGIKRVIKTNPGICVTDTLDGVGGISYKDWSGGREFSPKSEMRGFTCPAWWYQSADYDRKPNWKTCNENLGGMFSDCYYFCNKDVCWERFDKEGL